MKGRNQFHNCEIALESENDVLVYKKSELCVMKENKKKCRDKS